MDKKWLRIISAAMVFIAIIIVGGLYIENSRFGYIESAVLFSAAIIGAGCYWIGAKIEK